MKHNPTPVKGHEQKQINRWSLVVVMIIIAMAVIFSRCSVERELCTPYFGDGMITRIDTTNSLVIRNWKFTTEEKVTVYTTNHLGYEIYHTVYKGDKNTYAVGKPMIHNR